MADSIADGDVEQPKENVVDSGNVDDSPRDKMPAAGLLVSTIVLLVAVVSKGKPEKGDAYWRYGISLSVVAMFFALVFLSGVVDDRSTFNNPKVRLTQWHPIVQFLSSWSLHTIDSQLFSSNLHRYRFI